VAGTAASQLSSKAKANVATALKSVQDTYEKEDKLEEDKKKLKDRRDFVLRTEKALLGYAKISFATINDLGRGPNIIRRHLNPRQIKRSGITQLHNLHLDQALNQTSTEKSRHLTVLVRRRTINVDKLTQDSNNPDYPHITWADDIKSQINEARTRGHILATVADGNHRATFTEELASTEVKKYTELWGKVTTTKMSPDTAEGIRVTKEHLEILRIQLEKLSSWNCALFDWGECSCFPLQD
jgi:hypothetical protein